MADKGAIPVTESELVGLVAERVGNGFSQKDVREIVRALKEEITECVQMGCKVTLSGLLVITPVAKPGRKKGTVVRNPFDGSTKTLRADEPDKFNVKARVSAGVKQGFPSPRTQAGKELVSQLMPVARAAPAKRTAVKARGKR